MNINSHENTLLFRAFKTNNIQWSKVNNMFTKTLKEKDEILEYCAAFIQIVNDDDSYVSKLHELSV